MPSDNNIYKIEYWKPKPLFDILKFKISNIHE